MICYQFIEFQKFMQSTFNNFIKQCGFYGQINDVF